MKKTLAILFLALRMLSEATAAEPGAAAKSVRAFLDAHCVDCHGKQDPEGKVSLYALSFDSTAPQDIETWKRVYEQLDGGQMPPQDAKQPRSVHRQLAIASIKSTLKAAGVKIDELKALAPARGNRVDHDALFSGKAEGEPATPSRLWRQSAESYKQFFTRISEQFSLGLTNHEGLLMKSPWGLPRQWDFTDYSSSHRLSSAEIEHHMRNCTLVAKRMMPRLNHSNGPIKKTAAVLAAGNSATPEQVSAAVADTFEVLLRLTLDETTLKKYSNQLTSDLQAYDAKMAVERLVISALCHPEVLYRIERPAGDAARGLLAPRHLARSIAYTLTDREPDAALWQAAAEGKLNSSQDVREQVERMLNDPALPKPRLLGFFREYFGYTASEDVFKCDATMLEMQLPAIQGSFFYGGHLARDTDKLVEWVLAHDKQVLRTLLTTRKSFICTPELSGYYRQLANKAAEKKRDAERAAKENKPFDENDPKYVVKLESPPHGIWPQMQIIYGVIPKTEWLTHYALPGKPRLSPEPQGPEVTVEMWGKGEPFDANSEQRMGILTQPSWLIAHSSNFDNHPIHRGRWIRERLLGGHILEVPITVNAMLPKEPHHGLRERMRVTREEYCWKCHQQMDPLGLPFEQFDHFGRYRSKEIVVDKEKDDALLAKSPTRKHRVMTLTSFDTNGSITDSGDPKLDGPVKDPFELIEKLANSERVKQVFVRHVFRYFLGRNETLTDGPVLVAAHKAYRESNGSFKALLVSLLSSESFLYRTMPNRESK